MVALDAMEKAFESILDNGNLILDEVFMMNQIFAVISERVDPFREYIKYMWMEKSGHAVSKKSENNKVLPFDLHYSTPHGQILLKQMNYVCDLP